MFQLLFTNYKNKILSAVFDGREMIEVSLEDKEISSVLGNIYVGRVDKLVTSINAAFVEIQPGFYGYYSLIDNTDHIFLNKKNNNNVNQGDLLLVQVERDAVKTKAPILTAALSLSGRYVVVKLGKNGVCISSKIKNKPAQKKLKELLMPFTGDNIEIIARTNCETLIDDAGINEEPIINEAGELTERLCNIIKYAPTRKACSLMEGRESEYLLYIKNMREEYFNEIITDVPDIYNDIKNNCDLSIISKLRFYNDCMLPLIKLYGIESRISSALKDRVWLKSGGYLIIQPTEALIVIDVNTGKFTTGRGSQENGFFKVNCEAAIQIAKEIRLRNYSGIILVDFIDMKEPEHNRELMQLLSKQVEKDSVKTTVVDITRLGLVEMTRKKVKRPLYEQMKDL